ncbi:hypothetical protein AJ80_02912 [Polytolypa hystricis UAMH7299]|uniref:Mitochondrial adapter protein MCP1 transmembrane domain-containing protein n=1 Tax=Polytolypa hystricis (strain UAMH7299) TaxID=1447883 RepID=A0A2B7YQS5_POLH7|nr:hypothetical protein AJ80_02912 [Polytolypa hystricis UAMH7299]
MGEEDPSILSLQELDPSPVDEWTPDLESGEYFPDSAAADSNKKPLNNSSPSRSSFANLLGLSGRGVDYWLTAIQKYSTYPPTFFLTLHLTNTSLIPLITRSIPSSEPFLLLTRPLYQSPSLEPIILTLPIILHITSGLALRLLRKSRHARLYGDNDSQGTPSTTAATQPRSLLYQICKTAFSPTTLQAKLGYALTPLLGLHVLINRLVPVYVDGGSSGVGLGFVAHGIARAPLVMGVMYVGLVGVGVWHFVGGWAKWIGWGRRSSSSSGVRRGAGKSEGVNGRYLGSVRGSEAFRTRRRRRWVVRGLVVAGTALWIAGGLGVVGRGGAGSAWEARNWDKIYAHVPLLGRYLFSA